MCTTIVLYFHYVLPAMHNNLLFDNYYEDELQYLLLLELHIAEFVCTTCLTFVVCGNY